MFEFINVKLSDSFKVEEISLNDAKNLVSKYHYLGNKKFQYSYAYGVIDKETNEIIGCSVFGMVGGISTIKGWFGLSNKENKIFELSRLVIKEGFNYKNITSFLLGRSLRLIRKEGAKAVISLADSHKHIGYIYQACNFKYYGMSSPKTDFYSECGIKNPKGKTSNRKGVWIPRSVKHRYAVIFDNDIEVKYGIEKYPKGEGITSVKCCNGTNKVQDNRFNVTYKCPICCGSLI